MNTPWGKAQVVTPLGPGVVNVSCAGHGGVRVNKEALAKMHPALAKVGMKWGSFTWFEEDELWSAVALSFPSMFKPDVVEAARSSFRNWHPDEWELWTGEKLTAGQSYVLAQREFRERTKDKWVAVSASGDWKAGVPPGMVAIFCCKGGRTESGGFPPQQAHFLVSKEEYDTRSQFGFIADPDRHASWLDPQDRRPREIQFRELAAAGRSTCPTADGSDLAIWDKVLAAARP